MTCQMRISTQTAREDYGIETQRSYTIYMDDSSTLKSDGSAIKSVLGALVELGKVIKYKNNECKFSYSKCPCCEGKVADAEKELNRLKEIHKITQISDFIYRGA